MKVLGSRLVIAKAFHDGPLGADDHEFHADSEQGKWCLDVVDFFAGQFCLNTDVGVKASVCSICGFPMPEDEAMFKFHGHSGPCPKPAMESYVDEFGSTVIHDGRSVDHDELPNTSDDELIARLTGPVFGTETPSLAASRIQELLAERDCLEHTRSLMAKDWFDFCEVMEVTPDTQEAVAYDLRARASAAQKVAADMAKSLNWAIAEIEKSAEYSAPGDLDKLLRRAKFDLQALTAGVVKAEPVAWRVKHGGGFTIWNSEVNARKNANATNGTVEPLYASPVADMHWDAGDCRSLE